MAHSLILGMTESGKTTLAKRLAAMYRQNGFGVLVLDPLNDSWDCDFQTSDPDEFLRAYWDSRRCMVFIDESGDAIGQYDKPMIQTATKGRHWGHSNHYISQRGAMLARTVRDQCSRLFLFATALDDCKIHAREWNNPEILDAAKFEQGEYITTTRFGALSHHHLFNSEETT